MSEQMREEFEAWAITKATESKYPYMNRLLDRTDDDYATTWVDSAWMGWRASLESPKLHPLIKCLNDNGDLIAAQATIAQQAQMIEHLRGGPTPLYTAVDVTNADVRGRRSLGEHLLEKLAERFPNTENMYSVEVFYDWLRGEIKP